MLTVLVVVAAALASFFFSTLTFALRDFSRSRLEAQLRRLGRLSLLDSVVERQSDLVFVTAASRLLANIVIVIGSLRLAEDRAWAPWAELLCGVVVAATVSLVCSVVVPTAVAAYLGETMIALCARLLEFMRILFKPLTRLLVWTDQAVRRLSGARTDLEPDEIEKDILSVVEDGEKEGVVDTQEREMIESVIEFRDTQAGQIMTARPEIVALEIGSPLDEVKRTLEESGHSRIPVYDGTLDHISGILYARDLLKHLGESAEQFDIRSAIRPAVFVPETKPLRDLLRDFRLQKVHIAIVLDEYGGTAGLITIEDVLEELVGEISDEHEPQEPAMLKKVSETLYEADARLPVDELNYTTGLNLPEDAGYDTLGGFVSTALGRIPEKGTVFEQSGARFTVLDAEPHRVKRVRIELLAQAVADEGGRQS